MKTNEEKNYTVYVIEYKGNVKYVGKTKNLNSREYRHLHYRGTKYSAIPTDVDLNDVTFKLIETYNTETDALKREDELIQAYDTINTGWNRYRSGLVCVSDVKAYQQEYMREYKKTEKYKAYNREWMREYRKTEKNKDYQREWMRQYRLRKKAEKLAETV